MCAFLAVALWKPEFATALKMPRRTTLSQYVQMPSRVATEQNHCTFSVLVTNGQPTKLQLVVTLAMLLAPSVEEEDIAMYKRSSGLFEIEIACCTAALFQSLKNTHSMEAWNNNLAAHYHATITSARAVEIKGVSVSGVIF